MDRYTKIILTIIAILLAANLALEWMQYDKLDYAAYLLRLIYQEG